MRFGIQFGSYPANHNPVEEFGHISRRAQLAYKNNFEALFHPQHYLTGPDAASFQSLPLLAYLAGQVPGLYLGTSIFLLPLHPPVMVAEYAATLDIMSGGKFLFGIGQGYRDVEFQSFGLEKRQRRQRLVEGVQIIRKLWAEDNVTFHGEVFQLNGVSIAPKPLQRPGPPVLMGADTVQSVSRVPEVADHWISSRRHSKTFLRQAVPVYKKALEQRGREFKGLFIFRDLCIAGSSREAEDRIKAAYERRYRDYQREGQPGERYDLPFDELKRGRLIVGSPDEVIEEVMAYHQEFDAEFMWFMVDWPGFEPQWALETIQMFGEQVIPEIKRLTPLCAVP
jgi:alkanesulfonate monooxygenase SsuD/methylene tetrahydromethanopterin reductase-like flavin-dependent oxidoreductase (luciferase family)